MEKSCLDRRETADEFVKMRRALLFIRNIVNDYRTNKHDHLGFSYAFAVSLAEDLKERIEPASKIFGSVEGLAKALMRLGSDRAAATDIEQFVSEILLSCETPDFYLKPFNP